MAFGAPDGDYACTGGKILIGDDRELFVHVGWTWVLLDAERDLWEPRPVIIDVTLSRFNRLTDLDTAGLNTRAAIEALCALATTAIACGACSLEAVLDDWRARRIDAKGICRQIHDDEDPKKPARVTSSLDAIDHYIQQNLERWRAEQIKAGRHR